MSVRDNLTKVYFVRHAEADKNITDGRIRPLTAKGLSDRKAVTGFLADRKIDAVLSSPFKRAVDTVSDFAEKNNFRIEIIENFREQKSPSDWDRKNDFWGYLQRQWADFNYKLSDGESLYEVQERNITALNGVLNKYKGQTVVIGTHGTALSAIINYYDKTYNFDNFMAMVHLMPWITVMDFDGTVCVGIESINILR